MNRIQDSLKLLAILGTLASGCASVDHSTIWVDPEFSTEEQEAIQKGADLWDVGTGGAVHFNLVFGEPITGHHDFIKRVSGTSITVDAPGDTTVTLDNVSGITTGPEIYFAPEACPVGYMHKCIAHELGHRAGMKHNETDPTAIMYPSGTNLTDSCLNQVDVDMACAKNDCTGRTTVACGR